jgi:hypothetical protein
VCLGVFLLTRLCDGCHKSQVNAHATNRDNPAHAHLQRNLHEAGIGMPGGLGAAGLAGRGGRWVAQLGALVRRWGHGWDDMLAQG